MFESRRAIHPGNLPWRRLFLGGRGAGKSHSMSAMVHTAVRAGIKRIHFIAPTTTDFHDVNVEGKSRILATYGRDPRPRWDVIAATAGMAKRRNIRCSSRARSRKSLRGAEAELVIVDEIAHMRYEQSVFDNDAGLAVR